jgi:hypothetical protein
VRDRQTCVGCGKQSPETETNYTLISAQFGWRLTRYKSPDGGLVVEWRCPTCWREYKRARTIKPGESNPPPPPSDDAQPLRLRTPPMARPPTPMGSFRPRSPSTPDGASRRSSNPATPPPDRRPSSPQRPSPAPDPVPARGTPPRASQPPPRPSQSPPPPAAGPFAPGRPGRGSR